MKTSFKISRGAAWLAAGTLAMGLVSLANAQQGIKKLAMTSKPVPAILQHAILVGKPDPAQTLHLCVTLTAPNPAAIQAFADSVSNPSSPNYGHYLTPKQFGAKFGQSAATFQAVQSYLASNGMKSKLVGDNNLSLTVDCTVAQAETAFNTTINRYLSLDENDQGRHDFYSYSTPLYLPVNIAPVVGSVTGLQNHTKPIPRLMRNAFKRHAVKRQSGVTQPLTPQQTSTLYNTAPMHAANHYGQERTVAITSFDGFDLNNITLYSHKYSLPSVPGGILYNVKVITIDGGSQYGNPGGEGDLDQQMVIGQAPMCFLEIYDGGGDLQPVLAQEAQDDTADIVTESYGWSYDASDAEAAHTLHLQLTAEGITYFLASGDYGTEIDDSNPPATYGDYDPEVTNVGGTVASITATGVRTSEVTWYGSAGGWVTTPVVPFNVLPSWQKGTGVPTNLNYRLIPDVALHAAGSNSPNVDPGAYDFFVSGEEYDGYSGTSFSSPVFAASFALVEQQLIDEKVLLKTPNLQARMGRINDLIYAQNGNSNIWYDITSGPSNGTLLNGAVSNPTRGWDFVTGWGAANFLALANAFTASPSTTLAPASVVAYKGYGANPTGGVGDLLYNDGNVYTLNSIAEPWGVVASPIYRFQLRTPVPGLSSLTLTLVERAPKNVVSLVYMFNYSQGWWNLENTTTMTGSNVTINVSPYFNNQFISSTGEVAVVVRALNGTTSTGTPFTLSTDQATITETPATP
jgi:subtilase family serine protease